MSPPSERDFYEEQLEAMREVHRQALRLARSERDEAVRQRDEVRRELREAELVWEARFARLKTERRLRVQDAALAVLQQGEPFDPRGWFVYVLRGEDGRVLYVGQSRNVLSRVGSHLGGRMAGQVSSVQLLECDGYEQMMALEAELISSLRPVYNIAGNVLSEAVAEAV